ncbi:ABC transporter permease [Aeropyrum camini SY1 = JCM 12091]|uniref:ABC transporter permease n=2 Tax=Aeropyrum camini TaxID=229980 RepID=U3TFV9_9CREN|nr:ABC transporter permease [Aeropyrum camini SY1 = JCM 12091]
MMGENPLEEVVGGSISRRLKIVIALALLLAGSPIILTYGLLILSSFSTNMVTDPLLTDFQPTLDNWIMFLRGQITYATGGLERNVIEMTLVTLTVAVGVALTATLVSLLAAYSISRMEFRGRGVFTAGLIMLHAFPGVALIIGVYMIFRIIGDILGVLGEEFYAIAYIILARAALEVPMAIWLFKGFFDKIPWELEWSALVDGASRVRVWWSILVPLVKPGIAAVLIFTFLAGWEEFIYFYVFLKPFGIDSLPTFIEEIVAAAENYQLTIIAAAGTFYLLPTIVFFILTQKLLLEAYSGGLKG